ncbi:hypothetical protein F511_34847 [Dorcoceras hygrometricum]|uniref:Uncharacterized protein n=1 Tax=Dorcoceras hygrometricum TaxID=472368 RepID=A0A2Z7BBP0_9LAMI|nr:hypothetical protein F511_34847 [Dorcoceras hygrometricum]
MVNRLATSPHDSLGTTNSACKNQSVMVSVQYRPFNSNIPIRSTTIGKSRVSRNPITMHTSWRSNSDIACVTSIGYPCTRASGEGQRFVTLLSPQIAYDIHAQGRAMNPRIRSIDSYMHRDLTQTRHLMTPNESTSDLIHSTNGNHLESLNEGSSIDHQVTIHLHAQNITMFPTNESWYFASQMLVSISGGPYPILDGPID